MEPVISGQISHLPVKKKKIHAFHIARKLCTALRGILLSAGRRFGTDFSDQPIGSNIEGVMLV